MPSMPSLFVLLHLLVLDPYNNFLLFARMDQPDVQSRTEPNKACRLEILVSAYFTVVDGTKIYNKGRTVSWVVDSVEYTLTDLERDIGPYFQWGSYQKANFWVLERNTMKFKLDSDAQLLELVRSMEMLELMMIVGRHEEMEESAIHKVRAANLVCKDVPAITEVMDQEVPNAADVDMGPELTELPDLAEDVPNVAALDIGPEFRELPEFGETIAGPPRAAEEEKEHFMTVGCDPDGDEPAGADEEWRYFKKIDDNVQPIKNVEVEVQNRKRSRTMPYFDTEAVPNDEAGLLDDFIMADTTYDKENPIIKEGYTFVDKAEFMEIIRTYAIKNEFQRKMTHLLNWFLHH
uniref:Uncharacterized protein n=1 Tax=Avena sativa TaxID=4498 RepID=A0ACD5XNZ5_AVESA